MFFIVSKSHEKAKTKNELILLANPDISYSCVHRALLLPKQC